MEMRGRKEIIGVGDDGFLGFLSCIFAFAFFPCSHMFLNIPMRPAPSPHLILCDSLFSFFFSSLVSFFFFTLLLGFSF